MFEIQNYRLIAKLKFITEN